tara:strand:- start:243 stop:788 length:546 start_codon:yes stop_codon:yes gene_type:complete
MEDTINRRIRYREKNIKRKLDGILKTLDEEFKGDPKAKALELMKFKILMEKAGANSKELQRFQRKIDENMALVKKEKKMVEARKRTVQGIEAITNKKGKVEQSSEESEDESEESEDEIMLRNRLPVFKTLSEGKSVPNPPPGFGGGRKTRRRRKKKGKRKTKRRRKTKRKRKKKKRKTKRR